MIVPYGLRRINRKCYFVLFCTLLIVAGVSYLTHNSKERLDRKHNHYAFSATIQTMLSRTNSATNSGGDANVINRDEDYWVKFANRLQFSDALKRKDWNDWAALQRELERNGAGECGEAAKLKNYANQQQSIKETGFNALLSDAISVHRAVPDARHKDCLNRTYLDYLPHTSVIIIFHNENLSVLLRTLHSVLSRTPVSLLQEVILVDDHSTSHRFTAKLKKYIKNNLPSRPLRVLRLPQRVGLIRARLAGARSALGDVLVFLDAHVEATHNWLPPLLEPIALDWRTATTPIIDTIHYETFAYVPQQAHGTRGHFNWQFNYVQLPLLPEETARLPEPHVNPVMNGGLFAIAAKFFWHLGAYDEKLLIWGAEQFEISFKIWMCGGRLLEVPCSRVGHLYRDENFRRQSNRSEDFIARNYKRVAEVWMDEYKEFLYEQSPKLTQIDPGDLASRHALRQRLKCKSFRWYLHNIASDLLRVYPPVEPPDYANGALQSMKAPNLCLDALTTQNSATAIDQLRICAPDLAHPYNSQDWHLSFRHELRINNVCLEVQSWERDAVPQLWSCHLQQGNQYWFYDRLTQMLVNGKDQSAQRCLEADTRKRRVRLNACVFGKVSMRWRFGYINHTAMDQQMKNI